MGTIESTSLALISNKTGIPFLSLVFAIDWEKEAREAKTFKELEVVRMNVETIDKEHLREKEEILRMISKKWNDICLSELEEALNAKEINEVLSKAEKESEAYSKAVEKWDNFSLSQAVAANDIPDYVSVWNSAREGSKARKKSLQGIYSILKDSYVSEK